MAALTDMQKGILAGILAALLVLVAARLLDTNEPVPVCYRGVSYLQFRLGVTVEYGTGGGVKLCE